jgi:hypothetical protein
MNLWTNQFNIEEAEFHIKDNNVVKKYTFSAVLTVSILFCYLSLSSTPVFLLLFLVFLTFFAFFLPIKDKLIIDPDKFIDDSCNRMLTMLDKTWDFF